MSSVPGPLAAWPSPVATANLEKRAAGIDEHYVEYERDQISPRPFPRNSAPSNQNASKTMRSGSLQLGRRWSRRPL